MVIEEWIDDICLPKKNVMEDYPTGLNLCREEEKQKWLIALAIDCLLVVIGCMSQFVNHK